MTFFRVFYVFVVLNIRNFLFKSSQIKFFIASKYKRLKPWSFLVNTYFIMTHTVMWKQTNMTFLPAAFPWQRQRPTHPIVHILQTRPPRSAYGQLRLFISRRKRGRFVPVLRCISWKSKSKKSHSKRRTVCDIGGHVEKGPFLKGNYLFLNFWTGKA